MEKSSTVALRLIVLPYTFLLALPCTFLLALPLVLSSFKDFNAAWLRFEMSGRIQLWIGMVLTVYSRMVSARTFLLLCLSYGSHHYETLLTCNKHFLGPSLCFPGTERRGLEQTMSPKCCNPSELDFR